MGITALNFFLLKFRSSCFFNSLVGTIGTTLAVAAGVVAATTFGCCANKFVVDKLITISNKILYIMIDFGYFFIGLFYNDDWKIVSITVTGRVLRRAFVFLSYLRHFGL